MATRRSRVRQGPARSRSRSSPTPGGSSTARRGGPRRPGTRPSTARSSPRSTCFWTNTYLKNKVWTDWSTTSWGDRSRAFYEKHHESSMALPHGLVSDGTPPYAKTGKRVQLGTYSGPSTFPKNPCGFNGNTKYPKKCPGHGDPKHRCVGYTCDVVYTNAFLKVVECPGHAWDQPGKKCQAGGIL